MIGPVQRCSTLLAKYELKPQRDTIIHLFAVFNRSVMSDSLQPYGLQHARLPCPSRSSRVCSKSCPLSQWCHPTSSSSVAPFSSYPQSFPASFSTQIGSYITYHSVLCFFFHLIIYFGHISISSCVDFPYCFEGLSVLLHWFPIIYSDSPCCCLGWFRFFVVRNRSNASVGIHIYLYDL